MGNRASTVGDSESSLSASAIVADSESSLSASAIVAGALSGCHVLKIEGYSRTRSLQNGKCIESRPFHAAGHTWLIKYYPNGDIAKSAGSISLYLVLKDRVAKDVAVQFGFSFIDEVEKQTPSYIRNRKATRFYHNRGWGRTDFVKRKDLEQSERLKDDCFTVRCDMIVAGEIRKEDSVAPSAPFVVVPPPDWPQHFRDLLLSGKGADVRFRVGGETFAAHRCVLSARSPVFMAGLFGSMKESTAAHCVPIDDMRADVFKNLLHFVYTDSLPEMSEQEEAAMAQHLMEAADRYAMERLKLICEDRLCRHIDVSTAATTLALADQHRCLGLKEACFEFLKSPTTLDAVMATDGFEYVCKTCPSLLRELVSTLDARRCGRCKSST